MKPRVRARVLMPKHTLSWRALHSHFAWLAPSVFCFCLLLNLTYKHAPLNAGSNQVVLAPTFIHNMHTLQPLTTLRDDLKSIPISVLIYYDCSRAEYIIETVQSLKAQTFRQHEAIFINDACRSNRGRKAFEDAVHYYETFSSRVRVHVTQRPTGIPASRNIGFTAARGEFVFLLEASDVLEPTALEKLYWYLRTRPQHAYAGSFIRVFGGHNYDYDYGFGHVALHGNSSIRTVAGLVRKSVYERIGRFTEEKIDSVEDWDFWLECANHNFTGGTLPERLIWRRSGREKPNRLAVSGRNSKGRFRQLVFDQLARSQMPDGPPLPASEQFKIRPFKEITLEVWKALRDPTNVIESRSRGEGGSPRFMLIIPWMEMGGADRFNLQLIRMLTRDNWHVTVIATLGMYHPWRRQFEEATPDIIVLPAFLRTYTDQASFCVYALASRQPDVLMVSNSQFGYSVLPLLSSVAARLPKRVFVVDYNHMQEEDWRGGGYPRDGVDNQHMMDANIVASNHLKQWMVEKGAKPELIHTCYIGVNTTENFPDDYVRNTTRASLKIAMDEPVVLFPARLVAQKQPVMFAHAIARVAGEIPMTVLVAGDGPYRDEFLRAVKSAPWDPSNGTPRKSRLVMLGTVDFDRMYRIMQAADVVMVTSQMEGIALVAYEAMACGKVFIGAAVGGQPELVTESCGCGLLVAHGSLSPAEELEAYVKSLSAGVRDGRLRQAMGRAAAGRIRSLFALDNMYQCVQRVMHMPANVPPGHNTSIEDAIGITSRNLAILP